MRAIAYLGPEQTNTHLAAQTRFGTRCRYLHAPTVEDVFHLVERKQADAGVVPIENSLEGAVTHTLDRFIDFVDSPLCIQGEIERPIQHFLILYRQAKLADVRVVFSHSQALAQCRQWLSKHVPLASHHETNSTAEAVEEIKKISEKWTGGEGKQTTWAILRHPLHSAAIGRKALARDKRFRVIPIPEQRENKTRFLVIGRGEPPRTRNSKTSVLVALKDKPGALHDALVPFKYHHINLTKIESRPSKRKAWEYLFFIDFEGHAEEPRVKRALQALKRSTTLLRVLGSYPMGT